MPAIESAFFGGGTGAAREIQENNQLLKAVSSIFLVWRRRFEIINQLVWCTAFSHMHNVELEKPIGLFYITKRSFWRSIATTVHVG